MLMWTLTQSPVPPGSCKPRTSFLKSQEEVARVLKKKKGRTVSNPVPVSYTSRKEVLCCLIFTEIPEEHSALTV